MPDDLADKLIDKLLEPASDMLRKIAGPLCDEIGESMGVVARHYRYRLAVKMFQKTERMLREAGISPRAVPPRLFLPIVENASVQDDDGLHTRWAALLANAATSPDSVHPSYIEVLRQLTPKDAKHLDKLYDYLAERKFPRLHVQPWVQAISYAEQERRRANGENPMESFQNLIRLGLIETEYELDDRKIKVKYARDGTTTGVNTGFDSADYMTDFAFRFVQACRAPAVTIEGRDAQVEPLERT
jgi:hypothetical protein